MPIMIFFSNLDECDFEKYRRKLLVNKPNLVLQGPFLQQNVVILSLISAYKNRTRNYLKDSDGNSQLRKVDFEMTENVDHSRDSQHSTVQLMNPELFRRMINQIYYSVHLISLCADI